MSFVKPEISISTSLNIAVDWIEFKVLESPKNSLNGSDLRRMLEVQSESGGETFDTDDLEMEDMIAEWFQEIKFRQDVLNESYPFSIRGSGIYLKGLNNSNKPGRYSYLLCLLLSHAKDTDALNGKDFLDLGLNDPAREYFQIISTVAASGYLNGSSISFGWPRKDKTNFINALDRVEKLTHDGAKKKVPIDPAAPNMVKDFEIDIISWIPSNDNMPGKIFLISQVASGDNWTDKPIRPSILRDLNPWLFDFGSESYSSVGLFMPFCIEPVNYESSHDTLRNFCGSKLKNIIFYRFRIPYYVQHVFNVGISDLPHIVIDRVEDFEQIYEWVDEKISRLQNQ